MSSTKRNSDTAELTDKSQQRQPVPISVGLSKELLAELDAVRAQDPYLEILVLHDDATLTRFMLPAAAVETDLLSYLLKMENNPTTPSHPQEHFEDAPSEDTEALCELLDSGSDDAWDAKRSTDPMPPGTVIKTYAQLYTYALVEKQTRAGDYNILKTLVFSDFR